MIGHATCYGIRVHTHPTRSDSLVNNLHYKTLTIQNLNIKIIHYYALLPRYLVFTVVFYNIYIFIWSCLVDRNLSCLFNKVLQ